ncbi:hypothetical protein FRX31_003382 [Thalictrum thalictroides]|uniref:Uncharacterized protein n=1 Tax=Thalictrum thalictroides TaxID=46969 RepID=A0A7J6XF31_THATH|nr:hypothetical protein FRX31_003382 [Thalictrum thalictroides]
MGSQSPQFKENCVWQIGYGMEVSAWYEPWIKFLGKPVMLKDLMEIPKTLELIRNLIPILIQSSITSLNLRRSSHDKLV